MKQYPKAGGLFEHICKTMPDSFLLPFQFSGMSDPAEHSKTKKTFICPTCVAKAWGKPGLYLFCGCMSQHQRVDVDSVDPQQEAFNFTRMIKKETDELKTVCKRKKYHSYELKN